MEVLRLKIPPHAVIGGKEGSSGGDQVVEDDNYLVKCRTIE